MANISSFFGMLYFKSKGKPWTTEGYLAAYDVLLSMDSSHGDYGFCMDEDATQTSADWLQYFITHPAAEKSIGFWGSGRWTASNNFDNFDRWSKEPNRITQTTVSQESFNKSREKLLELMAANDWYFHFIYKDEEGGAGYIVEEEAIIDVVTPIEGVAVFGTTTQVLEEADYNLYDFCRIIGEERECEQFADVEQDISDLMKLQTDKEIQLFHDFLLEQEWDRKLSPYTCLESIDELPEGFMKAWKEYRKDAKTKK